MKPLPASADIHSRGRPFDLSCRSPRPDQDSARSMPEGDTIFRTAATLSRAIGGKTVRRFRSQLPAVEAYQEGIEGRRVERVEPRGKYLLIHFEDGSALLTHMRMTGSWHIYRPGEAWQKSERAARVVIETDD